MKFQDCIAKERDDEFDGKTCWRLEITPPPERLILHSWKAENGKVKYPSFYSVLARDLDPQSITIQEPYEEGELYSLRAAPHAVKTHRNDRRGHVFHDALEAAPERQQLADARDLALGENTDHFAGADGVAGGLEGFEHFPRTLLGGNGNNAEDSGERLDVRQFVGALEHHEPHLPVG